MVKFLSIRSRYRARTQEQPQYVSNHTSPPYPVDYPSVVSFPSTGFPSSIDVRSQHSDQRNISPPTVIVSPVRSNDSMPRNNSAGMNIPPAVNNPGFNRHPVMELEAKPSQEWTNERNRYLQREEDERQRQIAEQQQVEYARREQERQTIARMEDEEAKKKTWKRKQDASATCVRHLRWLIREKYRLDVYVWSMRKVQKADRDLIKAEYTKSDAILQEIYFIVNAWEEDLFDPEEWKVAKKIKDSISKSQENNQHLLWTDMPPWDRPEHGEIEQKAR